MIKQGTKLQKSMVPAICKASETENKTFYMENKTKLNCITRIKKY